MMIFVINSPKPLDMIIHLFNLMKNKEITYFIQRCNWK